MKAILWGIVALFGIAMLLLLYILAASFLFSFSGDYVFTPILIIQAGFHLNHANNDIFYLSLFQAFVLLIVPVAMVYSLLIPRKKLYGSARLSRLHDLKAFRHHHAPALVLGYKNGKLIQSPVNPHKREADISHLGLIAPTGTGKGVSFVIPNLLNWSHSAIVLDIKRENFDQTSGYRNRVLGQEIFVFDPMSDRTHKFNPFDTVRRDPLFLRTDLQRLAASLINDKEGIWEGSARQLFLALGMILVELSANKLWEVHLLQLYALSMPSDQSLDDWLGQIVNDEPISPECRALIVAHLSLSDKTRTSVVFTLQTSLGFLTNPLVASSLTRSDFVLGDFRTRKMTLYLCSNPLDLSVLAPLFRLFFEQFIFANTQVLPEQDASIRYRCLLLLDEFDALGKITQLAKAITFIRGYGLLFCPIFQSSSQVKNTYEKELGSVILENLYGRIVFATDNEQHAQEISKATGTYTFKSKSVTIGRGSRSKNISDQPRAVLLPEDIKLMGNSRALLTYRDIRPTMLNRIVYMKDKRFKKRLLPPVDLPEPDISRASAITSDLLPEAKKQQIEAIPLPESGELSDLDIDRIADQITNILWS